MLKHRKYLTAAALFNALLLMLTGCSVVDDRPVNALVDAGFRWSPFLWVAEEYHVPSLGEKQGIMIPFQFAGDDAVWYMQLDTGVWNSQIYSVPLKHLDIEHKVVKRQLFKPLVISFDAQVGMFQTTNNQFAIRRNYGSPVNKSEAGAKVGTIGLDYFFGRVLVLDFVNERFSITDSVESIPREVVEYAHWEPAFVRNGSFIVHATIGDAIHSLFYDSGASSFDVTMFSAESWMRLTGKQLNDNGLTRTQVSSWGQMIEIVGSLGRDGMSLFGLTFGNPTLWYSPALEGFSWPADGLIGNSLFHDEYVLILDLTPGRMRLGLSKAGG